MENNKLLYQKTSNKKLDAFIGHLTVEEMQTIANLLDLKKKKANHYNNPAETISLNEEGITCVPQVSEFVKMKLGELNMLRVERNYQNNEIVYNDTKELVHQLAVYDNKSGEILKLNIIDYAGLRFECSHHAKSIWVSFTTGVLFNFVDENEFNKYYALYKTNAKGRIYSKEKITDWLMISRNRIGIFSLKDEVDLKEDFGKNTKQ